MLVWFAMVVSAMELRDTGAWDLLLNGCVSVQGQPCDANGVASGEVFTAPVPAPVPQVMRPSGRLPAGACSPKVAEFKKRVQNMHKRMANAPGEPRGSVGSSPGQWIKDDEDCKFAHSLSQSFPTHHQH